MIDLGQGFAHRNLELGNSEVGNCHLNSLLDTDKASYYRVVFSVHTSLLGLKYIIQQDIQIDVFDLIVLLTGVLLKVECSCSDMEVRRRR